MRKTDTNKPAVAANPSAPAPTVSSDGRDKEIVGSDAGRAQHAAQNLADATHGGVTTTDGTDDDGRSHSGGDDENDENDDLIDPDANEDSDPNGDDENDENDGKKKKPVTLLPISEAARAGNIHREDLGLVRSTRDQLHAAETVMVILQKDASVKINDYAYNIKANVGVEVPRPVAEVLVNAGLFNPPSDKNLRKFIRATDPEVAKAIRNAG